MNRLMRWASAKRTVFAMTLTAGALTTALITRVPVARAASLFKNLQVLPKESSKEQIKAIMRAQAKALGVECEHCHAVPDMAADDNPHKVAARQMMKMTADINAKWLAGVKDAKQQVTCATCHQGHEKPPVATP